MSAQVTKSLDTQQRKLHWELTKPDELVMSP